MSRALRRQLCLTATAIGCLAALALPTAQARSRTSHFYGSTITNVAVSTASGYPAAGGTAVLAGTWTTNRFGPGAVIDHVRMTGHPTATTFTFRGTEVGFVPRGTFRDVFTGTATIQSDGTQTVMTHGRFVGGTGAYRGATGVFEFSGSAAPGSTSVTGHSIGTIWY